MTDGPADMRGPIWIDGIYTTFIPYGISLATTLDPNLIERIGDILGAEIYSQNSHLLLASTIHLSRSSFGDWNFENFNKDKPTLWCDWQGLIDARRWRHDRERYALSVERNKKAALQ